MQARAMCRLALIVATVVIPVESDAQQGNSRVVTLDSFRGMGPAELLRVRTASSRAEGRFIGISGEELRLKLEDRAETIQLAAIDTLWVHHSNVGRSMLIGTGIGAAAGLGYVALACGLDCSAGSFGTVAVIFGAVGLLTGVVLGAATSYWELRFFR